MLARHLSRQGQCSSLSAVSAASQILREATAKGGGVEASSSASSAALADDLASSLSLRRALSADASSSTNNSSNSSSNASTRTTSFGYETVPEELKASRVASVFSSVASSYDVMNDLMSGGAHRLWKSSLVDAVLPPAPSSSATPASFSSSSSSPPPSPLVASGFDHLDVAGGTGDVAFRVLQRMRELGADPSSCSVTVCDINAEMLREGERKARAQGLLNDGEDGRNDHEEETSSSSSSSSSLDRPSSSLRRKNNPDNISRTSIPLSFVLGDAESLPFPEGTFDAYTIAFGIRNVTRIPLALADARRVLKKGGVFACLEFSAVRAPVLKEVYDAYSFEVIPRMGKAVAGDEGSYRYLVESIRRFPGRRRFAAMMREAGFKGVRFESFAAGAVALHVGFKL